MPRVPLREALSDPNLLGTAIAGDSWRSWRTLLIAAMGEELSEDEREIFTKLTGREREPLQRVDQFAAVIGRRGGKFCAMATLACYLAGLCEHTDALVPGERGVLLCVALDQRVAKIILDYAEASFERSPILKQLIASRTADALELTNGITLEVRPASFRKLRGPTYIAVIADELAFWYVDAAYANPDVEILNAVEPGLATTGGPLILASSPHARRGVLWEVFRRHHGAGGDPLILVAHGASRTLNPSLPQRVVDRALEKDRARATAEYLAEFRTDVEGFVALEAVEGCVGDHREMLPAAGVTYRAFVDPSGGSVDAMTLAIAHKTTRPDETSDRGRCPRSAAAVLAIGRGRRLRHAAQELSRQQGCWRSLRRRVREGTVPPARHQLRSLQAAQVRSVQGHAAVAQRWPHHLAAP